MSERPNAIFVLIVAGAGGLAAGVAAALAALGVDAVVALTGTVLGALTACIFFLTELHRIALSSLLLVLLTLGSLIAFARAVFAYKRERSLLASLPLEPLAAGRLAAVADAARICVFVTPARRPAAFCFGLLRPRVVVTSGLLERLTDDEQAAVLWHEAEHARAREPARCLIARVAARTFFWVPAFEDLLERFLLVKELAADRHALARTSRAALAGALHEVASAPSIAAVGAGDLVNPRIERLFDPTASLPPLFRPAHVATSAASAGALAFALAFPSRIDFNEQAHLHAMLTSLSLHGLPGMALGLVLNGAVFAGLALIWRRQDRRRANRRS